MIITSSAFAEGGQIPLKYSCEGPGYNPPFEIKETPEGAKSLVLIMHDPDAPRDGGFTHWLVWNIKPDTKVIEENKLPSDAAEGMNDRGAVGYTGPCPMMGATIHHYYFYIYALDTTLEIDRASKSVDLEKAMDGHILGQGQLMGLYQLQQPEKFK